MTGRYKAYAEYKDSGVEFAPKIPVDWAVSKVSYISTFGRGLNITKANLEDEGVPCVSYGEVHSKYGFEVDPNKHSLKCVSPTYIETSSFALLLKGDFVFADTSEDIEGSGNFTQLVSDEALFAGYHTVIVRPEVNNYYRFLSYLFDSCEFRAQIRGAVKGVKVFSVTQAILKNANVWLPKYEEQQKIANFLDHETAKIDTLITKQEKLIELLKEKRQAVISHAVTKGLNPDAPMKDSGVEWLGDVPEHWSVGRLKNVLKIRNGKDYKHVEVAVGGYPVYGSGGIFRRSSEYLFDGESVLFGRKGTINKPLVVKGKFWTVDTMFYSELNKDIDAQYVHSQAILFPFDLLSTNTALPSMTQEDLLELGFVIPPYEEQLAISEAISNHNMNFSNIIEKATKQIELMKERKAALISAAVTGKIDVRDWQEPTYQESA
ncbi:restriction endonuclease subunit S [Vibrio parahaemolyticus]|uniref:restriction endonuclease subunit S n=1 Tax=Vibrio parahaemolyticus TaxID=670 RepID=UPI0011214E30|nr:restriction endonuclease subunit S [Vibrio parahaemolyticus]TNZ85073.1 restriction endonuclease subunit S [Vibrio parahaemolyticus]